MERVWRMTEPEDDRGAAFKTVIAYCDGEGFEATPDPGGIDREDRRGQDQSADDRGTATTDEQVHDGSAAQSSETVPVKLFERPVNGESSPRAARVGSASTPSSSTTERRSRR